MGNSVPRGRFISRPACKAEEQQQAATAATNPAEPAGELRRSRSFMELYSCKSSGSTKQESRVLPTSCTGVFNMENKRNRSDNPMKLPFELIKLITNNFSEELGRGAFGQVFKGVLEDGEEVAVKMLRFLGNINDQQFKNEFEILKRLKHPNIVPLVGFCDEAEELVEYNGKLIVCERIHRALCLEYMPNGNLGKLLHGENLDRNWQTRYCIIKGICDGLEYLQEGLEFPIFHLDLKPDNILLNQLMMPKISDFGLSRLIGEENTKNTLTPLGTIGYLPPEFINYQVISKEYDIYSLGVIITKIITGITGYSAVADMDAQEFVEHVHGNWKKSLQEIPGYKSLEVDCKQVKRCIEIARRCLENDRHKRPTIKDIVRQLDEMGGFIKLHTYARRRPVPLLICWDPGHGPRYASNSGGGSRSLFQHTRCAFAGDPLSDLQTLVLPLFGYGKQFEFRFLPEPPPPTVQDGRRVCDACGEATRGLVYHCSEQGLHLHPCCASLPDRIIQDGHAFNLHQRASRPCALCPENGGHRRSFWAYRCYVDGDEAAVELHVACLKETTRWSWEAYYRNQLDLGDGAQVDGMLVENMFSSSIGLDNFGEVAGTVGSFITALVFGNLVVKI